MDSRKFITSCTENMEDSTNDSGGVSQHSPEEVGKSSTRIFNENLPSVGECAPENQCLPSPRSADISGKLSNQSPIPSSQTPNDCLHNEDAFISPRPQSIPSSMSVLEGLDGINAKTYQKDLPPFAASSNADFASPPQHGTTPVNKWLAKNLKENNTPLPEKRYAETDANSSPVKRLRKTPESDSGEHGTETECTPKLSDSEVSETFYKSLTNLRFQQRKIAIENNEESESPISPATPFKRKISRNSSVESKPANDTTESNSVSPSSPADINDKSPTDLQLLGSKDDQSAGESSTEIKTIFDDSLVYSNSLETHSNPPDLLQTASLLLLPKVELESISDELKDASSEDVVLQPDLPVKTESTVHRHALNDKASCSNSRRESEAQISKVEGFESSIKAKEIQNSNSVSAKETQSASNVADPTAEAQILESSQCSPIILNPHLPSSCHLPRQSNSSVINLPGSILEFDSSDKKLKTDRNRSDYSTRSSTPKSRSQSKKLSSLRCRGIHRRSVSEESLTTRNLNEVQAESNQSTSAISSRSKQAETSRSLPEISKCTSERICVGKPPFREMAARSTSNTAPATGNPQEFSHSLRSNQLTQPLASNELSASRNDPEQQMHQNPNAALLQNRQARFFPGDTSTSRNGVSVTSPLYIDVFEGQASSSSYQPVVTAGSSLGQAFASRNQPEGTGYVNPTSINLSQAQPSTFLYQPTIPGGLFHGLPPFLPSRNEPAMEKLSTARDRSSTDDSSSSDDTPDSSDFSNVSDVQPEKHPECVAQARMLLLSVLKEIMLHDEEGYQWFILEKSFRRISKSCSELDNLNLIADLSRYLARKAHYLFDSILFPCREMAEMHTVALYGQLTVIVVDVLAYTLSVGSSRDFFRLGVDHINLKSLYDRFSCYLHTSDVERIRCGASKKRVKTIREMIQRLLLVVLAAFRLLLMHVGENLSKKHCDFFELILSGEDKKYFRRNIS